MSHVIVEGEKWTKMIPKEGCPSKRAFHTATVVDKKVSLFLLFVYKAFSGY